MSENKFSNFHDDPDLLRLLYDVNPTLVFVKDRQGRFVFANKALADVYACSVDELLGKTDADFDPENQEVEQFLKDDLKVMDAQEDLLFSQERVTAPSGESDWLQTIKRPLVDDNGDCNHVLGVSVDITKRVEAEERSHQLQDRLSRIHRMESLGVMAGGIAHDLNNILGPMVGYPGLLKDSVKDSPKAMTMLDEILSSAEQATAVIQDLLTLARKGVHRYEPISLLNCLEAYQSSPAFKIRSAEHPDVSVTFTLDQNLPLVNGNTAQFLQIVMNLMNNALESISGEGSIEVNLWQACSPIKVEGFEGVAEGKDVFLKIKDTGEGISPETQRFIFEPFYSSKYDEGLGSGLGLSVVYGIVQSMNGSIEVESETDQGSSFLLSFPTTEAVEVEDASLLNDDHKGSGRVLIIDDIKSQRKLARRILEPLGYTVETAASGRKGIQLIKNQTFDVALIDMMMPEGLDGLETFERIRKIQPNIICIIMSGFSPNERIETALKDGVCAFIQKPYRPRVLADEVQKALANIHSPNSWVI